LPSASTSLVSSMMQTNFAEAAATTFSRVSAAPPPLISAPPAGAVDVESEVARRIEIQFRNARFSQGLRGLARARYSALELYFTVFQRFYELGHRGSGADTQHHSRFYVCKSGLRGATFLFH